MTILGKPQGIFDLNDSDRCVGSYFTKPDLQEILGVKVDDLSVVAFELIEGVEAVDERQIQKLWYDNKIPNAPPADKTSFDELLLIAVIKRTYPEIEIERQIRIKRFSMDLKLTLDGKRPVFIEFDGPSHFAVSRWGPPKHHPLRKKKIIEDQTGIEVVNWAYWIQRCESNVRAIFDNSIKGFGVLWSTEIHVGDFVAEDSAKTIDEITKRFNAVDEKGYGYFYGGQTRGRINPEHPVIGKIKSGEKDVGSIIPRGSESDDYWLPDVLK